MKRTQHGADVFEIFQVGVSYCGWLWTVADAEQFWRFYSETQNTAWVSVPDSYIDIAAILNSNDLGTNYETMS